MEINDVLRFCYEFDNLEKDFCLDSSGINAVFDVLII